jgi:Putative transposase/Transposase zinc-binding domain
MTTLHRPEMADVFRAHEGDFMAAWGHVLSPQQRKAFHDIRDCRTAALGGHVDECDQCGHRVISYNSCRNRNCPKCQAAARAKWLEERAAELLPVEQYFHVVFTLPQELAALALQNGREIYNILFRAASETLLKIAADPKHLGASIGFLAVLHTWGQNLHLHPHLHCVVPGGGIAPDGLRWIDCRQSFFLPVKVLSRLFRNKFLLYLRRAFRRGKLRFDGSLQALAKPPAFEALCKKAGNKDWVVYAKPPFGGPEQTLKYLARYTHRVAISNSRIVSLEDGRVTFTLKDYADGNKIKTMTLEAVEFIRRFLIHVVPRGFVRIRQFGFLANRNRKEKLALCRSLLASRGAAPGSTPSPSNASSEAVSEERNRCPICQTGRLVIVEIVKPDSVSGLSARFLQDTS